MISTFDKSMEFGMNIINSAVFPNIILSEVLDNELLKIVSDECPETALSTRRTDNK